MCVCVFCVGISRYLLSASIGLSLHVRRANVCFCLHLRARALTQMHKRVYRKDYEGSGGLSQSKANDLMAQFLEDRRKDLEQETQLSAKHRGLDKAEESLRGREFYGGNFLQSMNPFKQVAATDGLDEKIAGNVVNSLVNTSGFDRWTVQMRRLQRGLGQAIPLQVAWDDGIPSLKTCKVLPCVRVFSCTGRPDCAVSLQSSADLELFHLWVRIV